MRHMEFPTIKIACKMEMYMKRDREGSLELNEDGQGLQVCVR